MYLTSAIKSSSVDPAPGKRQVLAEEPHDNNQESKCMTDMSFQDDNNW